MEDRVSKIGSGTFFCDILSWPKRHACRSCPALRTESVHNWQRIGQFVAASFPWWREIDRQVTRAGNLSPGVVRASSRNVNYSFNVRGTRMLPSTRLLPKTALFRAYLDRPFETAPAKDRLAKCFRSLFVGTLGSSGGRPGAFRDLHH